MKKLGVILLFFVFAISFGWVFGFYPVLKVNSLYISAKDYRAFDALAAAGDEALGGELQVNKENLLNALISNTLIREELQKNVKKEILDELIREKMNAYLGDGFESEWEKSYGINAAHAKNFIVLPRVEREILESSLLLQGREFSQWFIEAKKSAQVTLFLPSFRWNGSEVIKD